MMISVGTMVRIIEMQGEPHYSGRVGVVTFIDGLGQLHGTWGGCALIPETDTFEVVEVQDV